MVLVQTFYFFNQNAETEAYIETHLEVTETN